MTRTIPCRDCAGYTVRDDISPDLALARLRVHYQAGGMCTDCFVDAVFTYVEFVYLEEQVLS